MTDAELKLEEYKIVRAELEKQHGSRDTAFVLSLTVGLSILAYAIQAERAPGILFVFPLLVFLTLYVHYVYRRLLALKADAYIRVFLEEELRAVAWHRQKANFRIGLIYRLNQYMISAVFLALVGGNLYYIFERLQFRYFVVVSPLAVIIMLVAMTEYFRDSYSRFYAEFEKKRDQDRTSMT